MIATSAPYDTNAPDLRSWAESANDPASDFPIQNLPWGRFRRDPSEPWALGVAIGDCVLDVSGAGLVESSNAALVVGASRDKRRQLRWAISSALNQNSPRRNDLRPWLHPMEAVELGLPCEVRNYSDFFIGIHHAENTGRLYRPDCPLLPNYRWVPIGYHGRATSVQPSGTDFFRPMGQVRPGTADAPVLAPSRQLDFELEMGVLIAEGNALGQPISMDAAEDRIAGLTLLNDWSARDIQRWEAQPLGPFLAKSFATTLSPWMVTLEALAPFRRPFVRPEGSPRPLPYLDSLANRQAGAIDITLEVWLQTPRMRAVGHQGDRIVVSNLADAAYWTIAQLVAHHTINGCDLLPGDLLGTGTLSGADPGQAACLLELTSGGSVPLVLSNGEQRIFLEDEDVVSLRGYCERPGFRRIGFGECKAAVRPAQLLNPS